MRVKWFINLNQSLNLDSNNIFSGSTVINFKNKLRSLPITQLTLLTLPTDQFLIHLIFHLELNL